MNTIILKQLNKNFIPLIVFFGFCIVQCNAQKGKLEQVSSDENHELNKEGNSILLRFNAPKGFERTELKRDEFGSYLRNLPLKPQGAKVLHYDGSEKWNHDVYEAVVDLPIGSKDLHQCADAVMRLRAEYLWRQKRYNEIHFHFTNGFDVPYEKWMNGYRVVVQGNKTSWTTTAKAPSNTYVDFWNYLETIFMYAGTLSLSRELNAVSENALQIGDVFIQGGSPGHAVIVVDVALNKQTGEKKFILAQSYMPAQELQILINPKGNGVWYSERQLDPLETPEWTFSIGSLKRF